MVRRLLVFPTCQDQTSGLSRATKVIVHGSRLYEVFLNCKSNGSTKFVIVKLRLGSILTGWTMRDCLFKSVYWHRQDNEATLNRSR
jgi:hypothetical protein